MIHFWSCIVVEKMGIKRLKIKIKEKYKKVTLLTGWIKGKMASCVQNTCPYWKSFASISFDIPYVNFYHWNRNQTLRTALSNMFLMLRKKSPYWRGEGSRPLQVRLLLGLSQDRKQRWLLAFKKTNQNTQEVKLERFFISTRQNNVIIFVIQSDKRTNRY